MGQLLLRWALLLAALAAAAVCVFGGWTAPRASGGLACGLAWYGLSRRKARSIDRDSIGLPPR